MKVTYEFAVSDTAAAAINSSIMITAEQMMNQLFSGDVPPFKAEYNTFHPHGWEKPEVTFDIEVPTSIAEEIASTISALGVAVGVFPQHRHTEIRVKCQVKSHWELPNWESIIAMRITDDGVFHIEDTNTGWQSMAKTQISQWHHSVIYHWQEKSTTASKILKAVAQMEIGELWLADRNEDDLAWIRRESKLMNR